MLVGNWMSKTPVTVTTDTSMMRASKALKDKHIRTLCVVDDKGALLGVVTDRDIKEASPSKATTLDVHELYYLLSEIKVKDIMSTKIITITPDESVEKAAILMMDNKVGGLPVVDKAGKLVGVITQTDVFNVLISITGVLHGGLQIAIDLPDDPGTLGGVIAILNAHKARIMSVLTAYEPEGAPTRKVFIRIQDMDRSLENKLMEELRAKYAILFVLRDEKHPALLNDK